MINNDVVPEVIIQDIAGRHNADLNKSIERLNKYNSANDLSTICIIPNNGLISAKVTENWLGQVSQMNQKFIRLMMINQEKYHGFNTCLEQILATPGLSEFKYVLTVEEDTIFPLDGLHKLFEDMEKFDVVGGLSFTKGMEGHPMVYGDPRRLPQTMTRVAVFPETLQPCFGIGTAYTLFKLNIFKDERIKKPWFKMDPRRENGKATNDKPDLSFFENIHKLGYKVACDTRIRLGRYDLENEIVW